MAVDKNRIKPPQRQTKHHNNADIQVHVLDDQSMRKLGFTDNMFDEWYYCHILDDSISFNVHIKKDSSDWRIDVLDEDFLQPYDYQYYIMLARPIAYALKIKKLVDAQMLRLIAHNIISNWEIGDYI